MKKNILVFPCGSGVALEIFRSLQYSSHFHLIGGSSVDDHGKFVFSDYIGDVPFVNSPRFIQSIKEIVDIRDIDVVYPAMDKVINVLKKNEIEINCKVVGSPVETNDICLSKKKTYSFFYHLLKTPEEYEKIAEIKRYPVFLKPDVGYGAKDTARADSEEEVLAHLTRHPESMILEYLPGKEYTVDCFTNFSGDLLFAGPRERRRVSNGISVNTKTMRIDDRFQKIAEIINGHLKLDGAWFFQVKERQNGELVLLEVAPRLGGSSVAFRAKGVNFAGLSLFNAFGIPVSILLNEFDVEVDRALDTVIRIDHDFNHVYVDLDDTLVVDGRVNSTLVGRLYEYINLGKNIYLITKHQGDLHEILLKYRLLGLFDDIFHLKYEEEKYKQIKYLNAILIDDSYRERQDVRQHIGIPVFSADILP